MPHRAVLTHEDDLFGRVALFNNLVTLDQIVECARFIAAEIAAGRPGRSLAGLLIANDYISAISAGAVEAAVRKRIVETHAAAGSPPAPTAAAAPTGGSGTSPPQPSPSPKPPPLKARAPVGSSQVAIAIPADAGPGFDEERLRKAIAKIAPGRIYPEMLSYIVRHRVSIINVKGLAAAISEPEKAVLAALHRWQRVGLLRSVGAYPYCFSPTEPEEHEIATFLAAWNNPALHARTLGYILAVEE